jgi:hypothetical protein
MGKTRLTITVLVLSLVACTPVEGTLTTATEQPGEATTSPSTLPLVAGCGDESRYVEGGHIETIDNPLSDSTTIGRISWDAGESCETFRVSFVTAEGAPSTTPPTVEAFYVGMAPIIRIKLDVDGTVVTDQLVETKLVQRIFVVRSLDGEMFVDVHLDAPTQAHIEVRSSPSELILDLQPGIVEYPKSAESSPSVVLASPLDDSVLTGPLAVSGYARTFEGSVLIIVTDSQEVVTESTTTSADWVDTWGEFRETLTLDPGEYVVFVGERSPEDGKLEGLTIDLVVR